MNGRDDRPGGESDAVPDEKSLHTASLRILVIDDSRLFCEALRRRLLVEPDVDTVRIASTAAEALRLLAGESFAVAVAGPELARGLWTSPRRSEYPQSSVPVIVLADAADTRLAPGLFRLGVLGWASRGRSVVDLMDAIRICCRGDVCIANDVLASLTHEQAPSESAETARQRVLSALTHREKQIFMLLEQGMGRSEIADILQLSPNTVRTHIHRILRRLNVHSSLAALALARAGDMPML